MPKKSAKDIDAEVENILSVIDKKIEKNIQKDYKKNRPVLISIFMILLVLNLLSTIFLLFYYIKFIPEGSTFIFTGITVIIDIIMLYGLDNRKSWVWYIGLVFLLASIVESIIFQPFGSIFKILMLLLWIWHKDYLNK